jgi:neutral ceramidase
MKTLLALSLLLAIGASLLGAPSAPRLKAGAATSNITAPIGSLRVGSFVPYPTTHIHDELHARCLVLDDGTTRLALVVCDLLGLHRSVSIEARRLIQEATGIPPTHVLISATHTHSSANALGSTRLTNDQELDEYQRFVARRIADGVRRAVNLLRPAEIAFGSVDVPEHVINRRWFVRAGKEVRNPFGQIERVAKTGAPGPDFDRPAGPVDPVVSFIALREPSGRLISVYSAYSLHYAGIGAEGHMSADYFGVYCEALRRLVETPTDDPPFVALMANATSGDMGLNQGRLAINKTKDPYGRSRIVGDDVARKVHAALANVNWQPAASLDARFREAEIAWRPIEPELLRWAREVQARAPRLKAGNVPLNAEWATTPDWSTRLSYAGRVQALAAKTEPAKVPLQVLRIGDICIGTSPCETYAEIGLEFKQRSPFAKSFMVQLSHAMLGYLPTPPQFEFGEYSTWPGTNILEREASVKMLDALVAMAGELKPPLGATAER